MKYLNLKKITAVVLSIGMVFSSSAVTGFAADNSKKIATIPSSYINKVAEDIDNKYFYDGTYVDNWGHTRKGRQLGATYTKQSTEFLLWTPAATYAKVNSVGELVSGIDYLKELGVTTVQLAPFADFDGDSEYEILNYNVPEASYASNPSDSKTVIKECKEMIQALHSAGFSVVMEMPYTHASEENPLEKSVPWFYYRLNTDGTRYTTNTGYDNELATERKMYRNYMVNSMKYWAEEDANLVIWGDNYTKEERQNKTSSYDEIIGSTGGTYGERNEKAVKIYKQKAAMKYAKPGTLFMDGGEEMCNSVEGTTLADSSYVEWKDSAEYADVVSYYRGLMEIRKAFSPLAKSQTIKNSEAYVLTGTKDDEWNTMAVLNNESDVSKEITIPVQGRAATDWVVIANGESVGVVSLGEVAGSVITVPAYTTMILVDKESFDDVAVTSGKGKVIVNYVIKDSEQKLRESITLQGTSGTNYAVPENIKIPSGYTFLSKRAVCTVCDYQCKHAGGSATCVKKAVCTICSEEYGTYNMSIHEGLKSVAAKADTRTDEGNIEYWYCKDCDRYYIKQDGLVEIEKSQTVVAKITDTTSSDDTGKGGKTETVKEQTPDTGDNKRVFAWLLMFIIGGAAAGLTINGKKTEN